MNERELFLAALEIEDPATRQAHLQSACAGDADLLSRVESLLASHESQSAFLATPVAEQLGSTAESGTAATLYVGQGVDPLKHVTDESDEEIPLGYLQPSTRKDSLGRLDHYEILQVIGRGAFGIVLRAFDDRLQRVVAIKVLAPALASTSPPRKRFLREAQASAAIRHENVVSVYAVEEKPLPFLVMEFIPGVTLQQRLDERGPLDLPTVLRLGTQIAEGLAAAHAMDLIHRDIKPANILLESGSRDRVKITDFGLARAADDASLTQSGMIAGTPMYMAPEQALGKKLDQRADLFSLGSVLYQMVSGRPPFRAPTTLAVLKRLTEESPRSIQEIIPETPAWLCDIIAKLHAKEPNDRYQSAREVADVLANCAEQLKLHDRVRDVSRIPPRGTAARRRTAPRRLRTAALVTAIAVLLAGLAWLAPALGLLLRGQARVHCTTRDGDTQVEFVANDRVVDKQVGYGELTLPPGNYELRVTKPDPQLRIYNAVVMRRNWLGMSEHVTLSSPPKNLQLNAGDRVQFMLAYVRNQEPRPNEAGWVQLFNGKDLTNWKTHPQQRGNWEVKDGVLRGSKRQSYLFSQRDDYKNFHLRAEVKINLGGDSGLMFRAPFELRQGRTPSEFGVAGCYEAELHQNRSHRFPTGSVSEETGGTPPTSLARVLDSSLTEPDEWFTYEVIADGNRFITKINGSEAVNCTDPLDRHQAGHLALQVWHANTLVQFRKIEIKELLHVPPQ